MLVSTCALDRGAATYEVLLDFHPGIRAPRERGRNGRGHGHGGLEGRSLNHAGSSVLADASRVNEAPNTHSVSVQLTPPFQPIAASMVELLIDH